MTTLSVFRLHLYVLFLCEWWGRRFLNHSNIEAVLIKRQPGDSPEQQNLNLSSTSKYPFRDLCIYVIIIVYRPIARLNIYLHVFHVSVGPQICVYSINHIYVFPPLFLSTQPSLRLLTFKPFSPVTPGTVRGLTVACWITNHYHRCSNLGVGISEGCFVFDFASLQLEVVRSI